MDYSHYLIVTDLDGTFFGKGARLVERNLAAIELFKAGGGHITAGTGRIPLNIRKGIPACGELFNAPAVTANGAFVYDLTADVCLRSTPMDAEKTLAALEQGSPACDSQDREEGGMSCSSAGRAAATAQASFTGISGEESSVTRKRNIVKPHNVKEGRVESDGSLQLSFFQLEDPLLASLKEELDKADLNNMTPLQAFDLLRSMKEQMGL